MLKSRKHKNDEQPVSYQDIASYDEQPMPYQGAASYGKHAQSEDYFLLENSPAPYPIGDDYPSNPAPAPAKKESKIPTILGIVWGVILVAFAAFVMLDKLVIPKVVEVEIDPANQINEQSLQSAYKGELADVAVEGQTPSVTLKRFRWKDTDIIVADIYCASPQNIKSAFARDTYGYQIVETVSSMAQRNNAIIAINGDYYGGFTDGYVIRNGQLYRNQSGKGHYREVGLAIMNDGSFRLIDEDQITAEELLAQGAWQTFSFGPGLVENGQVICTSQNYATGYVANANPRTAIGHITDLHYVFAVCSGRLAGQEGLWMWDWATFMKGLGCQTAYNLDGGASTAMVFNGELISDITDNLYGGSGREREVSDCVYISAN